MGKVNKIKAKSKKGVIGVKLILKHPMETGLRKKKGKLVPANHVVSMTISHNGTKVVDADIGSSISKDPYFKFNVPGAKGDEITVAFKDNKGKSDSKTVKSK
ncbi:MAG: thiosulfate oxidation carrier complex protein SoxZ [Gammaproteobacteria bacterium]|nr:MAG: thiosulfate oxidation carrier complex protein SoxZ [Gammaproteobacteria bacterium]